MNFEDADELEYYEEMRIILLGKTGQGKSAVGNSIFGSKERNVPFQTGISLSSVTQNCQIAYRIYNNRKLCIIDTPGLFDTNRSLDEIMEDFTKAFHLAAPGPHAFLIVMYGRCTNEHQTTFDLLEKKFGQYLLHYCIILLTHEDNLRENTEQLADDDIIRNYFEGAPDSLQSLLIKCNYRCILINNRAPLIECEKKIALLIDMIKKNEEEHGNSYYNQEMFDQAAQYYQEMHDDELKNQRQMYENKLKEIREQIDQANWMRRLGLKENKELDEIQQQEIDHWSDQNHSSVVAGEPDLQVKFIAKTMNVLLDRTSMFTDRK